MVWCGVCVCVCPLCRYRCCTRGSWGVPALVYWTSGKVSSVEMRLRSLRSCLNAASSKVRAELWLCLISLPCLCLCWSCVLCAAVARCVVLCYSFSTPPHHLTLTLELYHRLTLILPYHPTVRGQGQVTRESFCLFSWFQGKDCDESLGGDGERVINLCSRSVCLWPSAHMHSSSLSLLNVSLRIQYLYSIVHACMLV